MCLKIRDLGGCLPFCYSLWSTLPSRRKALRPHFDTKHLQPNKSHERVIITVNLHRTASRLSLKRCRTTCMRTSCCQETSRRATLRGLWFLGTVHNQRRSKGQLAGPSPGFDQPPSLYNKPRKTNRRNMPTRVDGGKPSSREGLLHPKIIRMLRTYWENQGDCGGCFLEVECPWKAARS